MNSGPLPGRLRWWWLAGGMLFATIPLRAQTTRAVPAETPGANMVTVITEEPLRLDRFEVAARRDDAGFDATGMGAYEHQLRDSPFSNDMISADAIEDNPTTADIATELGLIATPSAVDLATGDSRVGLRGFPTPLLSNGFVRMGGSMR